MRVLDLFCGLGGFSDPFRDRGHEVVTLDIDSRFKPMVLADVRTVSYPSLPPLDKPFDVVLASPPCQMFSFAYSFNEWPPPWDQTAEALGLVACTFQLIAGIQPRFWVMENPHGRLAAEPFINPPRETIVLCAFGSRWKKPTDLWGRWPGKIGRPCVTHEPSWVWSEAERQALMPGVESSKTKRVRDPAERAKLPYGLGEELCRRMEAKIEVMA